MLPQLYSAVDQSVNLKAAGGRKLGKTHSMAGPAEQEANGLLCPLGWSTCRPVQAL